MTIYDRIFALAKKTAKALSRGEELEDLQSSNLFDDDAKKYILNALSEEAVDYNVKQLQSIDTVKDWEKLTSKLNPKRKPIITSFYKVAAVLILFISVAYVLFVTSNKSQHLKPVEPPIIGGINSSILTLSDGAEVALEKGVPFKNELVQSNGDRLEYQNKQSPSSLAYNYLTVPRGGQYQVALSDGTVVWLNADTKLKYPAAFKKGATRVVELLYGEAYFEVSPSEKHNGDRFQVVTNAQTIEVVGTSFDVKAYQDEQHIYTTLVEGKVNIEINGMSENLIPGEQSVLDLNTYQLTKSKINVDFDVAWIRGYFNFRDKPLNDIMKVLSRWYDVDIFFESPEFQNVKFSGLLSRKQNIEDILNGIRNTKYINAYEIRNKTITIK